MKVQKKIGEAMNSRQTCVLKLGWRGIKVQLQEWGGLVLQNSYR